MSAIILTEKNGIATLTFDLPNEKVNKLSSSVMMELKNHLEKLKTSNYKFVMIRLHRTMDKTSDFLLL